MYKLKDIDIVQQVLYNLKEKLENVYDLMTINMAVKNLNTIVKPAYEETRSNISKIYFTDKNKTALYLSELENMEKELKLDIMTKELDITECAIIGIDIVEKL